jgi:4-amino-4-deoxy-L-arabinose transferase-like glycosyltransferase
LKRSLYIILALYLVFGIMHTFATPVMEAWDEPWHFPVVKYITDHSFTLPVQTPGIDTPWRQQGSQPPLYYLLGAVLTAWIDTSDMETLRRMNPHAATGFSQPDGNANLIVHRTELETFPFTRTTLAVYFLRLFSLLLGLGTILVTYALAREIFPDQPILALGAAALNAFLPMFVFISASVSNDNLSNLVGNAIALLLVKLIKSERLPQNRLYVLLGVATGAGLLSKLSIGFFIPVIAASLLFVSLCLRDWRPLVIGGAISGGFTVLIAGWWYIRNIELYGDPTGLNVFLDIVGRRYPPANWEQLWSERFSFSWSYWGAYGTINILLPRVLYTIFDAIGIFAFLSAAVFLFKTLLRREWRMRQWMVVAITLILPLLTFISLIRWTTETPGSQGRLVFVALSSLSLWMAVGLTWWANKIVGRMMLAGVGGFFAAVTFAAPFTLIAPAYALPEPIEATEPIEVFDSLIGLQEAALLTSEVLPGQYVHLDTEWQMIGETTHDWSLFVHLVTADGVIIAQRDVYPGDGKLATSDLSNGFAWANRLSVPVPRTAYTPNTVDVLVGWYDIQTGERLRLDNERETVNVGRITLAARESDVPNPLLINFDNQVELVGYDLDRLSAKPGEAIELTLYWRALQPVPLDYVIFANIIEPRSLTKYAASNAMPANWTRPTSTWQVGERIEDKHTLNITEDALPGIYELEIGLYVQDEAQTFPRLRIVPDAGGSADNFLYLSRVRITP